MVVHSGVGNDLGDWFDIGASIAARPFIVVSVAAACMVMVMVLVMVMVGGTALGVELHSIRFMAFCSPQFLLSLLISNYSPLLGTHASGSMAVVITRAIALGRRIVGARDHDAKMDEKLDSHPC